AGYPLRPTPFPAAAVEQPSGHRCLEHLTLMHLPGSDMDADDEAVAVAQQMDLRAEAAAGTPQRMVNGLLHLRLLLSAQPGGATSHVAGARRGAAGPDDGTVDAPQVVVDFPFVIEFVKQRSNEADPNTGFTPTVEEFKGGLPGAVA